MVGEMTASNFRCLDVGVRGSIVSFVAEEGSVASDMVISIH
jgi:hypothetical protein